MSDPGTTPANDNPAEQPQATISFTDLAIGMGMDEDALLRRFADILSKREAKPATALRDAAALDEGCS